MQKVIVEFLLHIWWKLHVGPRQVSVRFWFYLSHDVGFFENSFEKIFIANK